MTRSKKAKATAKAPVDISSLSSSDRQALERVAAIFNKPVPEFCEELSTNPSATTRPQTDIPRANVPESERRPMSTTRPDDRNSWQQIRDGGEVDGYTPFAQLPGHIFGPEGFNQTELGPLGGGPYTEDGGHLGDSDLGNTEN